MKPSVVLSVIFVVFGSVDSSTEKCDCLHSELLWRLLHMFVLNINHLYCLSLLLPFLSHFSLLVGIFLMWVPSIVQRALLCFFYCSAIHRKFINHLWSIKFLEQYFILNIRLVSEFHLEYICLHYFYHCELGSIFVCTAVWSNFNAINQRHEKNNL